MIKIDDNKCIGCGLCMSACHEGAIGIVDGKAKLLRAHHCDGLGNCLPVCPVQAISFGEDEKDCAKSQGENAQPDVLACGCPGSHSKPIEREHRQSESAPAGTHLNQWPVQIKLVPPGAPYLKGAHLLIAADCAAYAYGNFHGEFMRGKITLIGCPKLDGEDYTRKLTDILTRNDIKSLTVARMEVPCCAGLEHAANAALENCGKYIPLQVVNLSTDGRVLPN